MNMVQEAIDWAVRYTQNEFAVPFPYGYEDPLDAPEKCPIKPSDIFNALKASDISAHHFRIVKETVFAEWARLYAEQVVDRGRVETPLPDDELSHYQDDDWGDYDFWGDHDLWGN